MDPDAAPRSRAAAWLPILALSAAGAAAGLVLAGRFELAAAGAAASMAAVTLSGRFTREERSARLRFADSVAERVADASVLGAVAWATVGDAPEAAALALAALVLGYLAAYVRAKASGLGFPVRESIIARSVRAAAVVGGLLVPRVLVPALAVAALVSLFSVIRETVEVSGQREAA